MTVLSLNQSRVNDREVNLGWCTFRTLNPFRTRTPELQDNQLLDDQYALLCLDFDRMKERGPSFRCHWRFVFKKKFVAPDFSWNLIHNVLRISLVWIECWGIVPKCVSNVKYWESWTINLLTDLLFCIELVT